MTFQNRKFKKAEAKPITGGKISNVEFQATNPDRVNIYFEGKYAFSLAALLVAERHLKTGLTLSAEEVADLLSADLYNKGLAAALQLLATRPRSKSEIQQALRKKYSEITSETISRILERLSELNYLNDESFAQFWVENRSAFAPRGRNLLRQELMKKGVPRDIIDAVIQAHLEAQPENEDNDEAEPAANLEESQALTLARKKSRSYAAEDWNGFYRKLGGFLLRRGYDYSTTSKVAKQVWQELKNRASAEVSDEDGDEENFF